MSEKVRGLFVTGQIERVLLMYGAGKSTSECDVK